MNVDPARVRAIFLEAVEKHSPETWDQFLDEASTGDAELRRQIALLLDAHRQAGSFLAQGIFVPTGTVDQTCLSEAPGTAIGPYKLVQQLGEGGMGIVFMAEQAQPVRRTVALKVIKPGMGSRQVIARFEAERQALALMDHPNIARVVDAGTTDSERPYFVMELVKGIPITRYCDEHHLTPRQRLELFLPVCHAIQHAHLKGMIHRDLKPSNLLVAEYDDRPVPKVIDFGVAKATRPKLTEQTLFTEFGQIVGTLEYMSPEQAKLNALDIDTRTDIYALGVLLYELLTGTTPFDRKRLSQEAFDELLRIIREEEPARPSSRVSTLGQAATTVSIQRQSDPRKLSQLFRGELDWIVMKCLEKDRNRRYETANGLASDIERYLHDEPVQACPPSAGYRLRKFVKRKKAGLLMGGLILAAVAMGGGSWLSLTLKQHARQAASQELTARALDKAEQSLTKGDTREAGAAIERAAGLLENGPVTGQLRLRLQTLRGEVAMVARLEGIRLEQAELKDGHFDNTGAVPKYAKLFREYGIDLSTLSAGEAIAELGRRPIRAQLGAALDDWARLRRAKPQASAVRWQQLLALASAIDPDPGRNQLRQALERRDKTFLVGMADAYLQKANLMPTTVVFLAQDLQQAGAVDKAKAVLWKAQRQYPEDFWINHNLAFCLAMQMRPPQPNEAVRFYTAAIALRPQSPGVLLNLGRALLDCGKLDDAVAIFGRALALKPDYADAYNNLGVALGRQKKLEDAMAAYRKSINLKPSAYAYNNLARALQKANRLAESLADYGKALALDPRYAPAWWNRGRAYHKLGHYAEAIADYKHAIELTPNQAPPYMGLGNAYAELGQWSQAAVVLKRGLKVAPKLAGNHFPWYQAAALCLYISDVEGYRHACRAMLERFGKTNQPEVVERLTITCLLMPDATGDSNRVGRLANRVVAGKPNQLSYRHFLLATALADYRAGRYADAVVELKRFSPHTNGVSYNATGFAILALVEHRLGHAEDARAALASARALLAQRAPPPGRPFNSRDNWLDWLHAQILCRETAALVQQTEKQQPRKKWERPHPPD